jgi:hypothetical protein
MPKPEPADGHADEETVEVAGDGDHEHRHAVHDRRDDHEDLPSARPVRQLATDEGSGDDDNGLGECAKEYLLRYIACGAADLVQQVVGLVGDQEGVGQNEHEAAGESPGEVGALPRIDVERAGKFPQRPGRLVRPGQPAILQRDREKQDEKPADRARDHQHGQLAAGEQLDQEGAAHRRDRDADTQDTGDQAALSGRDLVWQHRYPCG